MAKSLLDHAYDYLTNNPGQIKFQDIWAYCVKQANLTADQAATRVSRFYTNLMLDGRFVAVGDNCWDLRVRQKYEDIRIDVNEVYAGDDNTSTDDKEEAAEAAEEKAYYGEEEPTVDEDAPAEEENEEDEDKDNEF